MLLLLLGGYLPKDEGLPVMGIGPSRNSKVGTCYIQMTPFSSFPLLTNHKYIKGEERRKKREDHKIIKPEILTLLLPCAKTLSSSPNSPPHPFILNFWGVSVILELLGPPFLPASTNQVSIRQVPVAHGAGGLLCLCPGRNPKARSPPTPRVN